MAPDGSKLDAGVNPRDAPELAAKRAEEVAMVREMIALWCQGRRAGAAEGREGWS